MVHECRIAVVDKYPIFRTGIVEALARDKNYTVIAEGMTAEDARQIVRDKEPNILLLEAAVEGSLRAAQEILQAPRCVKVIILASTEDLDYATEAARSGVHGYIVKGVTGPELIKAIASVHAGEGYVSPDLAWRLLTKPGASPSKPEVDRWQHLSFREQQVLDYASKGLSNQEIACLLGLGLSTIKHYKTIAFRKMGVRNRLEAALAWVWQYELGRK